MQKFVPLRYIMYIMDFHVTSLRAHVGLFVLLRFFCIYVLRGPFSQFSQESCQNNNYTLHEICKNTGFVDLILQSSLFITKCIFITFLTIPACKISLCRLEHFDLKSYKTYNKVCCMKKVPISSTPAVNGIFNH